MYALILYFVFKPFYLWSSGIPQISDLILASTIFFIPIAFYKGKAYILDKSGFDVFCYFNYYALFVNLIWYLSTDNFEPVLYSIYLLFSLFFVFLYLNSVYYGFLKDFHLIAVIYFCFVFLFTYSVLFPSLGPRDSLSFNNPNQLASFVSFLYCMVFYIVMKSDRFHKSFLIITMLSIYLIMISLSFGALLVVPILFLFYLFNKNKLIFIIFSFFSVFAVIVLVGVIESSYPEVYEAIEYRVNKKEDLSEHVGIVEERGYDRIANHPYYNFLGAGEGARDNRIETYLNLSGKVLELHSTFGTVLFSYGLIGSGLFLYLFYRNKKDIDFIIIIISLSPYLLTHNVLRSPFFWLLLFFPSTIFYLINNDRLRK